MSATLNAIPPMDDPLGRYWKQPPDVREWPMDDSHILVERDAFDSLPEYSSSIPSGVYPGKCWRRMQATGPLFVWFGPEVAGRCAIHFREVLFA